MPISSDTILSYILDICDTTQDNLALDISFIDEDPIIKDPILIITKTWEIGKETNSFQNTDWQMGIIRLEFEQKVLNHYKNKIAGETWKYYDGSTKMKSNFKLPQMISMQLLWCQRIKI